jgi:hypothetical protein
VRYLLLVVCLSILPGCGTMAFTPAEYPLRDGLIAPLSVAGAVSVSNAQPSTDQFIVYSYGGQQLASNLKTITEVMVQQTQKELQKNAKPTGSGAPKAIALKVSSLISDYTMAFHWKSNIVFQATLGNGVTLDYKVPHASGSPQQDLNGCIAEGVMTLLNDGRVKAYLGK